MSKSPRKSPSAVLLTSLMLAAWAPAAWCADDNTVAVADPPEIDIGSAPAASTPVAAAVPTPAAPVAPATPTPDSDGTVIVGDRESPLGLTIVPWKGSHADPAMNLAPVSYNERMSAIDNHSLDLTVENYGAVTAHKRGQTENTP